MKVYTTFIFPLLPFCNQGAKRHQWKGINSLWICVQPSVWPIHEMNRICFTSSLDVHYIYTSLRTCVYIKEIWNVGEVILYDAFCIWCELSIWIDGKRGLAIKACANFNSQRSLAAIVSCALWTSCRVSRHKTLPYFILHGYDAIVFCKK